MEKCPFCLKNEVSKKSAHTCCDSEECAKDLTNFHREMMQMVDNENQHHTLLDQLDIEKSQEEAS